MKRITYILSTILLLFSTPSQAWQGMGTEQDPYILTSLEDFLQFREIVNQGENTACALLQCDIDLSSVCYQTTDTIVQWNAIGNDEVKYQGTFDGGGHTISNLFVHSDIECYKGVFGCTYHAMIQNLGVEKINMNAGYYVGGIVGYCQESTITNCYTQGQLRGYFVSGIAGTSINSSIRNCISSCDVLGNYNGHISGYRMETSIVNCFYYITQPSKASSDNAQSVSTKDLLEGNIKDKLNLFVDTCTQSHLLHWEQLSGECLPSFYAKSSLSTIEANAQIEPYSLGASLFVRTSQPIVVSLYNSKGELLLMKHCEEGNHALGCFREGVYFINRKKIIISR